jgi:hypothetical protein
MLKSVLAGVLCSVGGWLTTGAYCQNEIVIEQQPIHAQSLSGRVHIVGSPEGVKGVLVEECTRDWKAAKRSTYTDDDGHFSFPGARRNRLYYLRVSLTAFKTVLIKVTIDASGTKQLSVALEYKT